MFKKLFGDTAGSALIEESFREVTTMIEQSERMYNHAIAALLDNAPLEVDLEDLDDVVDEAEQRVRRRVLEHLAIRPDQDLVSCLLLMSLVQDGERVGDFARGLVELVPLARSERVGPFASRLRAASEVTRALFTDTRRALVDENADLAVRVTDAARENKREMIALTADLAASDASADMAVVYSGAARILRRITSHLSNMCSTVSQPFHRIRHDDEEA